MSREFTKRFDYLSNLPESLRPLTPSDIDIPAMKLQLIEAGLNLNIGEQERASLAQKEFRTRSQGRGPGMVAVLGKDKTKALFAWCRKRDEGGPLIGEHENTEGRGLRQLAADIIQLVTDPAPTEETIARFCQRTNQRVRKGLLREKRLNKEARITVRQAFAGVPEVKRTFASVPSGSVDDLWSFLISPQPRTQ